MILVRMSPIIFVRMNELMEELETRRVFWNLFKCSYILPKLSLNLD